MNPQKVDAPIVLTVDQAEELVDADEAPPLVAAVSILPLLKKFDASRVALVVIATLALLFALQWAKQFLVPLMFGIFIAYTLNPVVLWLERLRIPRVVGSSLVMLTILVGAGFAANTLFAQFQSIVEALPESAHKVSRAINNAPGTISQLQSAATEIEQAAGANAGARAPNPKKVAPPVAEAPTFRVSQWLVAGSMSFAAMVGEATIVIFLVFFLLLAGDSFKRKLIKMTGPTLSIKKNTVHMLEVINTSIQNYMFMLLVTNALLAVMMWIALRSIGLQNAGAWAAAAGFLHVVPYFGPLLIMAATGLSAFIQFESISMALLVAGISLAIATVVGTFVTTWMTGRIARMNPAAVFISLLFWGWLWGVWGMLLGIPIMVIIKVISEHVVDMQTISDVLSD
jgi:predicted PurR-regulated permease PerM